MLEHFLPLRYRWPIFEEGVSPKEAYYSMQDEELKCLLRTPNRSKFKDCGLIMDEGDREKLFIKYCEGKRLSRKTFIEALFYSTFEAWKNYNLKENASWYVGYNPGMIADFDKVIADFPEIKIIHIIRNPYSSYADYLKRPYPEYPQTKYAWTWNIIQHLAYTYERKYPNNFKTLRIEDFLADKKGTLSPILSWAAIEWSDNLTFPSFNGKKLDSVYPWGTIVTPTVEENLNTAKRLSPEQKKIISTECRLMIDAFGYSQDFETKL
jgi:hypothetical protein